jgi:integrase
VVHSKTEPPPEGPLSWPRRLRHLRRIFSSIRGHSGTLAQPRDLTRDPHNPADATRDRKRAGHRDRPSRRPRSGLLLGGADSCPAVVRPLYDVWSNWKSRGGEDLGYVADQLGHEDPTFTLKVYRQATRTRPDRLPQAHRADYDRALEWARIGGAYRALPGTRHAESVVIASAEATKNPA